MKTNLLDLSDFKVTFAAPMRDVLETATNVIDIWPYFDAIPEVDLSGRQLCNKMVERVYRNEVGTHDHVLIPTLTQNVFLVVVVDSQKDEILGHHLLDLNHEYGLSVEH